MLPISVKTFPISESKNPTPFVARITQRMKNQNQILQTLGVIFTAGVDPLQTIGVTKTMSDLYGTGAKLLLTVALADPNSPYLYLPI